MLLITAHLIPAENVKRIISQSKVCQENYGQTGSLSDDLSELANVQSCIFKIHADGPGDLLKIRLHEFVNSGDCLNDDHIYFRVNGEISGPFCPSKKRRRRQVEYDYKDFEGIDIDYDQEYSENAIKSFHEHIENLVPDRETTEEPTQTELDTTTGQTTVTKTTGTKTTTFFTTEYIVDNGEFTSLIINSLSPNWHPPD